MVMVHNRGTLSNYCTAEWLPIPECDFFLSKQYFKKILFLKTFTWL